MEMMMAGGILRLLHEDAPRAGALARTRECGRDGAVRVAIVLLVIAALVLAIETDGIHWLWGALSGLHGSLRP